MQKAITVINEIDLKSEKSIKMSTFKRCIIFINDKKITFGVRKVKNRHLYMEIIKHFARKHI